MNIKNGLIAVAIGFSLASIGQAKEKKERQPNQTVNFDKSLSIPEGKIAQALGAGSFSCQREHSILTELLSADNLNTDVIEMAKDLYQICVSSVASAIGPAKQSSDQILNKLQKSKLICTVQAEKIENALSESNLDLTLIQKLKESFETCRSGAKTEIIKNNK